MIINLYDILELPKDANFEEIKSRYKSLAQQNHPDKGGDPETFKQIKHAYEVLSDPVSREKYDNTGQYGNTPSIRDEALDRLSRLFFNVVPNINAEVDDLISIMKNETNREKQNVNNNINICNGHIFKLNKIINKIKKKNTDSENLIKMFAQKQLDQHNNEMQNFIRQIKIINAVIELLDDYQYNSKNGAG